ncbi:MAG TPA: type 3 dihydrofolate reductase [Candidatus Nanoarchaeia archaeon]|nr:type 3 dihydrofolate reductase [Candidatus Nanoarchaeia archaeon]
MIISLIAAIGKNNVIGINNKLPWKLSADLKRFKTITSGKPVIMGRKTFESIGKPLPNRKNIIITRDKNYKVDGCIVVHSPEEALNVAKGNEETMIIGGEQIFNMFLPQANRLYLTVIEKDFVGDAYFPEYRKDEWKEVLREWHKDDGLKYAFVDLERKN